MVTVAEVAESYEAALALQGHAIRLWKGIAALLFIVGLVLGVLVGRAL